IVRDTCSRCFAPGGWTKIPAPPAPAGFVSDAAGSVTTKQSRGPRRSRRKQWDPRTKSKNRAYLFPIGRNSLDLQPRQLILSEASASGLSGKGRPTLFQFHRV